MEIDCKANSKNPIDYYQNKEYNKAFELYSKDINNSKSMYVCGHSCFFGLGTPEDKKVAVSYFKKALLLDNNNLDANFALAFCYKNGFGTHVNKQKAFVYYLNSAKLGHKDSQNNLGQMYKEENNKKEAFKWFVKAYLQGHKIAANNLGLFYYKNKKNYSKAIKYFKEAENYEFVAYCYEELKNFIEALYWIYQIPKEEAKNLVLNDFVLSHDKEIKDAVEEQEKQINQLKIENEILFNQLEEIKARPL